jgi:hypothetical protein
VKWLWEAAVRHGPAILLAFSLALFLAAMYFEYRIHCLFYRC